MVSDSTLMATQMGVLKGRCVKCATQSWVVFEHLKGKMPDECEVMGMLTHLIVVIILQCTKSLCCML